MTYDEWLDKGTKLFGEDMLKWKFKCPSCGYVASGEDYKAITAPVGAIAFSCIGRYMPKKREAFLSKGKGPCNYAGGGLFKINPIEIILQDGEKKNFFEFAE